MIFTATSVFQRRFLRFFVLGVLIFGLTLVHPVDNAGQNQYDDLEHYSLATPKRVIFSHLRYLQSDLFDPAVAATTLDVNDPTSSEAQDLAVELLQVLDGNYLYVDLDELPDDPNYSDSITGKHTYVLFSSHPDIRVTKVGDKWLYSKRTVKAIPALLSDTYPWGTYHLLGLFGQKGTEDFLGLALWQYLGLAILIVFSLLFHYLLTWIFHNVITRIILKLGQRGIADTFISHVAKPLSLFIIVWVASQFIPALQLPILVAKYLGTAFNIAIAVFVTVLFYRFAELVGAFMEKFAAKTETTLDDQLVPLARKAFKVIVIIGGVLYVLSTMDINITALLAGISIGSLAFALAAQDTVKNFFGSIMIFIDRPFQIGDWIVAGDIEGDVEEVGIRSTRVRTFYNSLVYIPNGKLADMMVDNMGMRSYRRYKTHISVTYDTPPAVIDQFVDGLRSIVQKHPATRKDYFQIHFSEMGDSGLKVLLYVFFKVGTWTEEMEARHEVLIAVLRLAEALNIRFAFPTGTLHVENFPEKQTLTPAPISDPSELQRRYEEFFTAWQPEITERYQSK